MSYLRNNKWLIVGLILTVLVSLYAALPLFHPGFFQSDDGEWMIIRSTAFHEAFRDKQIPTRYLGRLNYEYGYPVSNFLYPGYLYGAEVILLLGFGFVDTIKIIFGLSLLASGVFMFLWLRALFDTKSGIFGAILYVYLPYHLFTLYSRGSIGEVLALAVVPFSLYALEKRNNILAALGVGFLVLSHNTMALFFLPILFLYMVIITYKTRDGENQLVSFRGVFELGLGISAFFWIPALFDLHYTVFSQTKISEWENYFADIHLAGIIVVLLVIMGLAVVMSQRVRSMWENEITEQHLSLFSFFLFLTSITLLLSLSISSPLWHFLPSSVIQFPFRLLAVTCVGAAFLFAFFVKYFGRYWYAFGAPCVLFAVLLAAPYGHPAAYFDKGEAYYATNQDTTTVHQEYMPKWVKENPQARSESLIENPGGAVLDQSISNKTIIFGVSNTQDSIITINKVFFPGWSARVDGVEATISSDNQHGAMQLPVPSGIHTVALRFQETPVRLFADFISIAAGTLLLIIWIRRRRGSKAS